MRTKYVLPAIYDDDFEFSSMEDLKRSSWKTGKFSSVRKFINRILPSSKNSDDVDECNVTIISYTKFSENEITDPNCSRVEEEIEDEEEEPQKLATFEIGNRNIENLQQCDLCCEDYPSHFFPKLISCSHRFCANCMEVHIEHCVMNNYEISCPECDAFIHPTDIKKIIGRDTVIMEKYEEFSVRRYLSTVPNVRYCPAVDCNYAVIADFCKKCPQLTCENCSTKFCYNCKTFWHDGESCKQFMSRTSDHILKIPTSSNGETVKPCPGCESPIMKANDGSCNHVMCTLCHTDFCWLCLKPVNELHFVSPSGCTWWGKRQWSKKRKFLWRLTTMLVAPVAIPVIAALALPGITFASTIYAYEKASETYKEGGFMNFLRICSAVGGAFLVSPIIWTIAVVVGVPFLLVYAYGMVPISMLKNE